MIKMFTAFTEEMDDADFAVSEILEQLGQAGGLLRNSVGILHCSSDFADNGVVREVCARLPFPVAGCTTLSGQVRGGMSQTILTLTVLTSDDVRFATGVSVPVEDDPRAPVADLYGRLTAGAAEKPALLVPFLPFLVKVGGDEIVEQLDAASGGVPAFGTLAISNEPDYSRSYTILNGELHPSALVLLALFGDVKPVFHTVSVEEKSLFKQKAVVTGAYRNVLQTVNNMPAVKFLETVGLAENGDASGLEPTPFILTLEDGSRLIRACFGTDDTGALFMAGAVPLHSTLTIAALDAEAVVRSTGEKLREIRGEASGRGVLIYSCAGRNYALTTNAMAEHEEAAASMEESTPFHFVYSGGEIFPSFLKDGGIANHLQNDSMIVCIL
jgi:hypothetical protein